MSSNMLAASMPAENDSGSDDEWWDVSIDCHLHTKSFVTELRNNAFAWRRTQR